MTHHPIPDTPPKAQVIDVPIGFVGGGNMAQAIIGGLVRQGLTQIHVLEPFAASCERLQNNCGVNAYATATEAISALETCSVVLWAVKPQVFADALKPVVSHTQQALHLSVMAGIPSAALAKALHTERVVRTMPNVPALIGYGMTGLFARAAVSSRDKALAEVLLQSTGQLAWFDDENALDAVTALSGSGPAYVFYFLEAMQNAGERLGLDTNDSKALALQTFLGASTLAANSEQTFTELREQVNSKGGTTYAALSVLQNRNVQAHFIEAMQAAYARSTELGIAFTA